MIHSLVISSALALTSTAVSSTAQEPEGPAEAGTAEPAPAADAAKPADAAPPADAQTAKEPERYNQWHLLIAPGVGYVRGPRNAYSAIGPSLRFGAWKLAWRRNFMIGGGPSLVYSYLFDKLGQDRLHFLTVNGDFVVGGGKAGKFAVYAHMTAGLGVIAAKDGATGTSLVLPGVRAAAGVGAHGYITQRLSLGTLVDFGYMGGLGVDAFLTLGLHFGKKPK